MVSQTLWNYSARPELKMVLKKLEERFASSLRLLPSDPEWLTFQVDGLTDFALIQKLEREQVDFFGSQISQFHITCEATGRERGVSVCLRPTAVSFTALPSGFWFY